MYIASPGKAVVIDRMSWKVVVGFIRSDIYLSVAVGKITILICEPISKCMLPYLYIYFLNHVLVFV